MIQAKVSSEEELRDLYHLDIFGWLVVLIRLTLARHSFLSGLVLHECEEVGEEEDDDGHEKHVGRIDGELVSPEKPVKELVYPLDEGLDLPHETLLRRLGDGGHPLEASLKDGETQPR